MTSTTGRVPAQARRVARDVFGHPGLRPGQAEALVPLLEGHDVLMVSATGSGKSLVYQVAGVLTPGCTLLVSPLLALQQDQLDGLPEDRRTAGARLSSAETPAQRRTALEAAVHGDVEFLAVSPEQLANDEVRERLAAVRPSLVAVDEAHCVSSWGHDFRPDYLRLGELVAELGQPRLLALTATAAGPVREEIVERLHLDRPVVVVTGFDRPNLALRVERCADPDDQRGRVLAEVQSSPGAGIVYCRTRRSAEEHARLLAEAGVRTAVYHAGLGARRRRKTHEAFRSGDVDVVVATSAFGMGIDKADVRLVLHAQVPESLDTYYQEAGRAGRDGEPARAVLLYRPEDLSLGRFFSGGVPSRDDVAAVVRAASRVDPGDRQAVQAATGLGPRKAGRLLNLRQDVLNAPHPPQRPEEVVDAMLERAEAHRAWQRTRVEQVRAYAESDRCRAELLLGYFGERLPEPCGRCDRCEAGTAEQARQRTPTEGTADVGAQVVHRSFGPGSVVDVDGDELTVLFDRAGYRTLDAEVVRDRGLLCEADPGECPAS